jgi:RNA polymerase sigma-70 factor (sigma-E family)
MVCRAEPFLLISRLGAGATDVERRVSHDSDNDFRAFVVASRRRLVHLADLLTGDRGRAEGLAQHALVRTYLAWSRVRHGDPEAYARRVVINANVDWWRRRSWREQLGASVPELAMRNDHVDDFARRDAVRALAALTPRERAVIALRFYCQLSENEAAREIGCAVGTVTSTTARALAKLRNSPHVQREVTR